MSEKTIDRALFVVTEQCGRQLIGYCDYNNDDGKIIIVEDSNGVLIHDPVVFRDMMVQTAHGPGRATNLSTVYDLGWITWMRVRASSYTAANEEIEKAYQDSIKEFIRTYERARAAKAGIHITDDISEGVAASEALRRMRQ